MELLVDVDDEPVVGLGGLYRPLLGDPELQVDLIGGGDPKVAGGLIQFSGL